MGIVGRSGIGPGDYRIIQNHHLASRFNVRTLRQLKLLGDGHHSQSPITIGDLRPLRVELWAFSMRYAGTAAKGSYK